MPFLKIGKLQISLGFILVMCGMVFLDGTVYMCYILGSIALHELFHIIAIYRVNGRIKSIKMSAFRISIELPNNLISYRDEIKIAFAGPLANLFIVVSVLCICFFYKSFPGAPFLCVANFFIFIVNMMPIEFLDGGRMLKAYLLTQMDLDTAAGLCSVISGCCIFPLLAGGFLLLSKTGYNFSLLLIAVFLAFNFIARIRGSKVRPIQY